MSFAPKASAGEAASSSSDRRRRVGGWMALEHSGDGLTASVEGGWAALPLVHRLQCLTAGVRLVVGVFAAKPLRAGSVG